MKKSRRVVHSTCHAESCPEFRSSVPKLDAEFTSTWQICNALGNVVTNINERDQRSIAAVGRSSDGFAQMSRLSP